MDCDQDRNCAGILRCQDRPHGNFWDREEIPGCGRPEGGALPQTGWKRSVCYNPFAPNPDHMSPGVSNREPTPTMTTNWDTFWAILGFHQLFGSHL